MCIGSVVGTMVSSSKLASQPQWSMPGHNMGSGPSSSESSGLQVAGRNSAATERSTSVRSPKKAKNAEARVESWRRDEAGDVTRDMAVTLSTRDEVASEVAAGARQFIFDRHPEVDKQAVAAAGVVQRHVASGIDQSVATGARSGHRIKVKPMKVEAAGMMSNREPRPPHSSSVETGSVVPPLDMRKLVKETSGAVKAGISAVLPVPQDCGSMEDTVGYAVQGSSAMPSRGRRAFRDGRHNDESVLHLYASGATSFQNLQRGLNHDTKHVGVFLPSKRGMAASNRMKLENRLLTERLGAMRTATLDEVRGGVMNRSHTHRGVVNRTERAAGGSFKFGKSGIGMEEDRANALVRGKKRAGGSARENVSNVGSSDNAWHFEGRRKRLDHLTRKPPAATGVGNGLQFVYVAGESRVIDLGELEKRVVRQQRRDELAEARSRGKSSARREDRGKRWEAAQEEMGQEFEAARGTVPRWAGDFLNHPENSDAEASEEQSQGGLLPSAGSLASSRAATASAGANVRFVDGGQIMTSALGSGEGRVPVEETRIPREFHLAQSRGCSAFTVVAGPNGARLVSEENVSGGRRNLASREGFSGDDVVTVFPSLVPGDRNAAKLLRVTLEKMLAAVDEEHKRLDEAWDEEHNQVETPAPATADEEHNEGGSVDGEGGSGVAEEAGGAATKGEEVADGEVDEEGATGGVIDGGLERRGRYPSEMHELLDVARREQEVYGIVFHEIIRQVTIECYERGRLLSDVRDYYQKLFDRIPRAVRDVHDALVAQRTISQELMHEVVVSRARMAKLEEQIKKAERTIEKHTVLAEDRRVELERLTKTNEELSGALEEYSTVSSVQRQRYEQEVKVLGTELGEWKQASMLMTSGAVSQLGSMQMRLRELELYRTKWSVKLLTGVRVCSRIMHQCVRGLQQLHEKWTSVGIVLWDTVHNADKDLHKQLTLVGHDLGIWVEKLMSVSEFHATLGDDASGGLRHLGGAEIAAQDVVCLTRDVAAWSQLMTKTGSGFGGDRVVELLGQLNAAADAYRPFDTAFRHIAAAFPTRFGQYLKPYLLVADKIESVIKELNVRITGANGIALTSSVLEAKLEKMQFDLDPVLSAAISLAPDRVERVLSDLMEVREAFDGITTTLSGLLVKGGIDPQAEDYSWLGIVGSAHSVRVVLEGVFKSERASKRSSEEVEGDEGEEETVQLLLSDSDSVTSSSDVDEGDEHDASRHESGGQQSVSTFPILDHAMGLILGAMNSVCDSLAESSLRELKYLNRCAKILPVRAIVAPVTGQNGLILGMGAVLSSAALLEVSNKHEGAVTPGGYRGTPDEKKDEDTSLEGVCWLW